MIFMSLRDGETKEPLREGRPLLLSWTGRPWDSRFQALFLYCCVNVGSGDDDNDDHDATFTLWFKSLLQSPLK